MGPPESADPSGLRSRQDIRSRLRPAEPDSGTDTDFLACVVAAQEAARKVTTSDGPSAAGPGMASGNRGNP